jgi:glycosyltransferase involved in cell wall biosynthesis
MKNNSDFPRVLIVYNSRINQVDTHGVSIRGWFADWPKQSLAQIYSGGDIGDETFCGFNFKIKQDERRFGRLFIKIKGSSIGKSSYPILVENNTAKKMRIGKSQLFKSKVSELLMATGLWELIFKPVLSIDIIRFIQEFKPQIIYCQGYNLTFALLPVMIKRRFNLPICFQTGDDWPSNRYKDTLFSFIMRPVIVNAAKTLIAESAIRLANCSNMVEEFEKKYNLPFVKLMMCDSIERFRNSAIRRIVSPSVYSIIYTGGIGGNRWESIIDLSIAADLLSKEGINILITVFTSNVPMEAVNKFKDHKSIQILPDPSHEELPSYLKGGDILFLPETFDELQSKSIHLSLSTKAHLYMFSEIPILVYGSHITGIVNYALEEKWAYIVQKRDKTILANALKKLLMDTKLRQKLVKKGYEVAIKNHDKTIVRQQFLANLSNAQY